MRDIKIEKRLTVRDTKSFNLYLKDIDKYKLLSIAEEEELAIKAAKGDVKARNKLINSNLRFVVSIAKKYQYKGLCIEDLVNAGNSGLISAADRFDHTRGFKFTSYAVWWIRQAIQEYINQQFDIIRKPSNVTTMKNRVDRQIQKLRAETDVAPSEVDILESLGYDDLAINAYKYAVGASQVVSGDAMNEEGSSCIFDSVSGDSDVDPLRTKDLHFDLVRALDKVLSTREKNVIISLFGIGQDPETMDQVSEKLNLTRERTRQISSRALNKLKTDSCRSLLSQYL